MYSEADCREWQDQYFAGDKTALDRIWFALLAKGADSVKAIERARAITLSAVRKEEIIADAADYLIELYLRKTGWRVQKSFSAAMYHAVRYAMGTRKEIRTEQLMARMPDDKEAPEVEEAPQLADMVKDLCYSHKEGNRVVVDLARYIRYADAIMAIARYMPKPWIHNEAVKLNTVWRVLHWRADTSASR